MSDFSYKNILDNNLFRIKFFSKFRMPKKYMVHENIRFLWNSVFFAKNVQFKEADNLHCPKNGHFLKSTDRKSVTIPGKSISETQQKPSRIFQKFRIFLEILNN